MLKALGIIIYYSKLKKGVIAIDIAKNLDTLSEMTNRFYVDNVQSEELIDRLTKINRNNIKLVS